MEIDDHKPTILLNEREMLICRDLLMAAGAASEKYSFEFPAIPMWGEKTVRQIKPLFDLYRLYHSENTAAISRLSGDEAVVLAGFQNLTFDSGYSAEDVLQLHLRLQGFLKEIKQQNPPPQTLYIADCHFYHNRICTEMDHRGFSGFEEMNEHMIAQWNSRVRAKDDVYVLGDFSIAKGDATAKILDRLKGKLHLIIGNHDKYLEDRTFNRSWFRSIEHYAEIRDNSRNVILSHYPLFCYKGQYRLDQAGNPLTYMLYGHVHNTQDEQLVHRFIMETRETKVMSKHATEPEPIPCNMINCFCMFSNYQPMTLDEWIIIDRKRRQRMNIRKKTGL